MAPTPSATTMKTIPTRSCPVISATPLSFASPSPSSSISINETTIYLSASLGSNNNSAYDGRDEEWKLGLGLRIGIGIPLMTLLGLICFLLRSLLRRIYPTDFRWSTLNAEKQQQQRHPKHTRDSGDNDAAVTGHAELLSTELYEAQGASRQIRPAELET